MSEIKKHGIKNYELWPCIIMSNIVTSINWSHKMIVKDAKEKGQKECLIAEDDFWIVSQNGLEYFLKNKPDSYDIYSACNYLAFERPEKPGLIKFKTLVGFHFYFIHERYYDRFLNTPDNDHIDTAQNGEEMYALWPFSVLQLPGYSSNNKAACNYNVILSECDIYK